MTEHPPKQALGHAPGGANGHYPGYDVLAKQHSPSWNAATRAVIEKRLALPHTPRYLDETEWRTLSAICARICPQPPDREQIPLPALVDGKLFENHTDGYRYAGVPKQGEAWKRGLAALDAEAQAAHAAPFHALPPDAQDALLRRMQAGELNSPAWAGMPPKLFFEHRLLADITHAYYAHPIAWNEIGFGGPASPRGYVRLALDRRDSWEPAEARPGHEAAAERENRHVR